MTADHSAELALELEEELDVIRAIYGDDAVSTAPVPEGILLRVLVDLRPRVEQGADLVSVCFVLDLPVGYPANAVPCVSVDRSRGLSDAGVKSLLQAAERASQEHGLQEVGCTSQLLAEVSEALDAMNDECECSICLGVCRQEEMPIHTSCGHVYHAACIGHWDALKIAEAERQALEKTGSVRSEQEALRKEIADGQLRGDQLVADSADCQNRLLAAQAAQARVRQAVDGEEDSVVSASDLSILPNSEEEIEALSLEELLQLFNRQVQEVKGELQHLKLEDRRTQGRLAEQRRRLKLLEDELATDAANRSAAGLPCPVCRAPIERKLLPDPRARPSLVAQPRNDSDVALIVNELPESLRKHVREEQRRQQAILARRTDSDPPVEEHMASLEESTAGAIAGPGSSGGRANAVAAAAAVAEATSAAAGTAAPDGNRPGNRWRGKREQQEQQPQQQHDKQQHHEQQRGARRSGGALDRTSQGHGRKSTETDAHRWTAAADCDGRSPGDGGWSEDHSSSQGGNWSWNSWGGAWGGGSWSKQTWDGSRHY